MDIRATSIARNYNWPGCMQYRRWRKYLYGGRQSRARITIYSKYAWIVSGKPPTSPIAEN